MNNKESKKEQPLVSIVTVCFNAEKSIEKTIQSVISQKYPHLEYLVIDGDSIDDTKLIVSKYMDSIDVFISEKDNGVYDAMNKASIFANGDWVLYMNCGDVFYSEKTVSNIFSNPIEDCYGVVFGDTIFTGDGINKIIRNGDKPIHKYMPSCHQSIFCRRSLLVDMPFDLKYKFAADYDFFYRLWKKGCNYYYIPEIVSEYDICGGLSQDNYVETKREILKISNSKFVYYAKYLYFRLKCTVGNLLKRYGNEL